MDDFLLDHASEEISGQYLVFNVNDIDFGVEIEYINDIISFQPTTPVPNSLPFLEGMINIRGSVVPVIDMRKKFGYDPIEYNDRTCIVVLSYGAVQVGIIVDEVRDVLTIPPELLQDPPRDNRSELKYIKKIAEFEGKVRQIIDSDAVFEIMV